MKYQQRTNKTNTQTNIVKKPERCTRTHTLQFQRCMCWPVGGTRQHIFLYPDLHDEIRSNIEAVTIDLCLSIYYYHNKKTIMLYWSRTEWRLLIMFGYTLTELAEDNCDDDDDGSEKVYIHKNKRS